MNEISSRQLVLDTLNFNKPPRVPRDLWILPWAEIHHGVELASIQNEYPSDMLSAPGFHLTAAPETGDPYAAGIYVDPWGCVFTNCVDGIIGEVKKPLIPVDDEEWADLSRIHIPKEWLTIDKKKINAFYAETDRFVMAGACPRPFERLQFIRGTEQLLMDLLLEPKGMFDFIEKMHDFYCRLLEGWSDTDVDGIIIMDDWGSQISLLIDPALWVRLFKPLYRDYIEIAHRKGKKIFMHSDGYILPIIPHLIELGLDALNCQIFCMGVENLAPYRGVITFWGEIDRQHILPYGESVDVENAVDAVYRNLWRDGGCIAQCEFGPGARPENVKTIFARWEGICLSGKSAVNNQNL